MGKSISEEELIVQIHFQSDPLLGPDDLNIIVNAVTKNDKVINLLELHRFLYKKRGCFWLPLP